MYSNRAHIPSGSPFENDKMRSCMVHMQVTKYLGCTEYTSIRVGTRVLRTAGGISAFAFLHLVSLFFFFFSSSFLFFLFFLQFIYYPFSHSLLLYLVFYLFITCFSLLYLSSHSVCGARTYFVSSTLHKLVHSPFAPCVLEKPCRQQSTHNGATTISTTPS